MLLDRRRIDVAQSVLGPDLFAEYTRHGRRVGRPERPPLICCWGGALYAGQYQERRVGTPAHLIAAVQQVFAGPSMPDFDVLLLPNPVIESRSRAQLRLDLHHAFLHEFLPQTSNPEPSALGFLGYSAGAFVVTCLALDITTSRAVAAVGGAGMAESLLDTERPIAPGLRFAAFINSDDPLADETSAFQDALADRGHSLVLQRGDGGHEIEDYLDNGLLRAAATWTREALFAESRS
jgi:hypothetical protein